MFFFGSIGDRTGTQCTCERKCPEGEDPLRCTIIMLKGEGGCNDKCKGCKITKGDLPPKKKPEAEPAPSSSQWTCKP